MAQVQIEEIVDHLSTEMRKALEEAVRSVAPTAQFDSTALFKAFRKAVGRKCNTWEHVPDFYVKN
ncbi:hypothetical protein [Stutzerimonas nitrititolerans]|uniref:hypothetical protein n=1 Tax=Stutzerimonas nitrititolerans TaxID=2482751 RepID=UPI0028ACB360|nr:hypothetical protein [Stutzerimonas nitrititolerans]